MASHRDHAAAQLRRDGQSYGTVAAELGFPDVRAAHKAVTRALAEPAQPGAVRRALRVREADAALAETTGQLRDLLYRLDTVADVRMIFRIFDALLRVSDQRCRLLGLYVHPWRYDHWWRREMPVSVRSLRWQAEALEWDARIPDRVRPTVRPLAPVIPLRPPVVEPDLTAVSASVRQLLITRRSA